MDKKRRLSFILDYGDINDSTVRVKYGYLEGTVSIVGNSLLFVMKLTLGLFLNSIALIADSVHTLSDVSTSAVVIFGFKVSKKPSDKEHPFGHGRAEYIATLVIAILLVVTGLGFIQQSIERLINTVTITNLDYAVPFGIILIVSALVKEWMARFSFAIGKKINSDILIADAWHHRSDALASVGVGISLIGSYYGYVILDPIFGVIVSLIIIYVAISLGKTSSNYLMGQAPDKDLVDTIRELAKSVNGVKGVHSISVHDYGNSKVITFHAEIENNLMMDEAHTIADELENKILEKTNHSTIIHVEPKEMHYESRIKERIIEKILEGEKGIISFHNVRVIRRKDKDDIKMHLVVDKDMAVKESHNLSDKLESIIRREYGPCNLDIHFDPCSKECNVCLMPCKKRS
ncbi:MAG: cation-efflux pump [Candidatus Thermoplasmatota archaeon]|jgi:cation diffusion facilitator family transporter|nr:cation-efflux pump [Candidatus Thermoplasmatota archaeon]